MDTSKKPVMDIMGFPYEPLFHAEARMAAAAS